MIRTTAILDSHPRGVAFACPRGLSGPAAREGYWLGYALRDGLGRCPNYREIVGGVPSAADFSALTLAKYVAAAVAILLALGACSQPPSPVTATPRNPAICEALRPAMPISYSGSRDTRETVRNVREANARFEAACP